MIAILLSIPLVLVSFDGFYLNFGYYVQYFENSGYTGNLPRDMAIFFIFSELTLWGFSNKNNIISATLKYGLVVFSVFATLSSQFTSTSEKVTENERIVYEKIDNSADIKRYEDQIKIQDERINDIFSERREKSFYGLTNDEMNFAQSEKARYENLLSALRAENKTEIKQVFIVKSIYGWIATELPRIFTSGLNEEFIRVIFQLFSSLILASMAPVCISIIRKMTVNIKTVKKSPKKRKFTINKFIKLNKKHRKQVNKDKVDGKHELSPVIPETKPVIPAIGDTAASNIIIMLMSSGKIIKPEEAVNGFKKNKECSKLGLSYSLEQCKYVYDFILSNKLENESRNKIMEKWKNKHIKNYKGNK